MYSVIRRLLFLLDAEKAHYFAMRMLMWVCHIPGGRALMRACYQPTRSGDQCEVMGITFPNRVGLAAGFDKDARCYNELSCLGFGHIEVGTVTPEPQPGNDKPRLFRLKADRALINRMGFNNGGVARMKERLSKSRQAGLVIGGNLGKNKWTPNEEAHLDYFKGFHSLYEVVDYFVVNVSSPNTPGLRELQDKEPLLKLLNGLQELNRKRPAPKPILLKIAPDLTDAQLDDILDIVGQTGITGIIATNTTLSRAGLQSEPILTAQTGGLSGAPLTNRSTEVIRYLVAHRKKTFVIIGAGGIDSPDTAIEKFEAGADLVQVYTGFIYEGPSLAGRITRAIRSRYSSDKRKN
ncbi:MAG: quinone-dependent dihydroorotate dehydrogenase [Flavobacteriales bacterium]|nr:quinone-dependent dihydroorotate dehydrogenase [Flavobacteriales bacterium]